MMEVDRKGLSIPGDIITIAAGGFRFFDPRLDVLQKTMITFASFPKPKDSFSYAPPKLSAADENGMDIDDYEDDDDGEDFDSGTKLICPGEPITSSHAYMRCVLLFLPRLLKSR